LEFGITRLDDIQNRDKEYVYESSPNARGQAHNLMNK